MENISKLSPLEVAAAILNEKKSPMNINELLDAILEAKGFDKDDNTVRASLYCDLVASSKFVYLGEEDLWDLKLNHPLEEFDKDGSAFTPKGEEYVEDETERFSEDDLDDDSSDDDDEDDEDRDEDEDLDEENEEESDEYEDEEYDEDYDDSADDDFEEDKYNELMDDYEDMYD